jgi:hypothetical protein
LLILSFNSFYLSSACLLLFTIWLCLSLISDSSLLILVLNYFTRVWYPSLSVNALSVTSLIRPIKLRLYSIYFWCWEFILFLSESFSEPSSNWVSSNNLLTSLFSWTRFWISVFFSLMSHFCLSISYNSSLISRPCCSFKLDGPCVW